MHRAKFIAIAWRVAIWTQCFSTAIWFLDPQALGQTTGRSAGTAKVKWQPAKLVNGSPVLFQVAASPKVESVSASWLGHNLVFFRPASEKLWYALAGVPVDTAPGSYDLTIKETFASEKPAEIRTKVKTSEAAYPKITIKVSKQFTEPNPQQM